MQISNSVVCEIRKYCIHIAVNHPLWIKFAFPPTEYAVALLGCTLHKTIFVCQDRKAAKIIKKNNIAQNDN